MMIFPSEYIDIGIHPFRPGADTHRHPFIIFPLKTIQPFEINSLLNQAVSRSEFEFVLTNPASYVEYKMRFPALKKKR